MARCLTRARVGAPSYAWHGTPVVHASIGRRLLLRQAAATERRPFHPPSADLSTESGQLHHTYGTLLHTGGTDLKVISKMRHRKVGTSGDIYVHADTALQREAAERLATALRAAPCAEPRAKNG